MTRVELVARVQAYLGNRAVPTDDTDWYEDRVQDGYQFLTTYRDKKGRAPIKFPELMQRDEATTTHVDDVNWLPFPNSEVRSIHALYDETNSRYVRKRGLDFFHRRNKSDNGPATAWCPFSVSSEAGVLLWRNPPTGTVFTVYYHRDAEDLSTGISVPQIKEDWHLAIAMAGAAIGAGLWGMDDTAAKLSAMFAAFVDSKTTGDEDVRQGGIQNFRVGPQNYTVSRRGSRGR